MSDGFIPFVIHQGGKASGLVVESADRERCPDCECCARREDGGCSGAGPSGDCHRLEPETKRRRE
jgi:hypothetical protein